MKIAVLIIVSISLTGCLSPFYSRIDKKKEELNSYYKYNTTITYRRNYVFSKKKNETLDGHKNSSGKEKVYYKEKVRYYDFKGTLRSKRIVRKVYEGPVLKKHEGEDQGKSYDKNGKRISNQEAWNEYQKWWR